MKYCSICLQPDTRPNGYLTKEGICPACKYFNELKNVDWDERYSQLKELIKKFPKNNKQHFDCIIGVSGGKDSTRQALWVRDKLKLNPLLVCFSYPPEQVTQRGVDNLSNLIELGFDTLVISSEPQTWQKSLKEAFLQFTNWCKASELALMASVPKIAIRYKIPLILWGENPGLQLGDMKTLGKYGYDGNNLRNLNTLAGGDVDWLIKSGLTNSNLISFLYPSPSEFEESNIQIVYLGWFWKDWTGMNNAMYSLVNGLQVRDDTVKNTGDIAGVNALDEDWVTLNQMIKYYKYGFGRVSDHINESIRSEIITREEGIDLVEKYDGSCGEQYIKSFCEYIDISIKEFWDNIYNSVNKDLFEINSSGQIIKKFKVGKGLI
tara:strand:+ start:2005 stop:3138 length:1134 start_codon:yes stop_codon:yes gene_type:complete